LALQGYRVLGVDLDPQASMTALHGYQPEYDIQANETMYAAIRYDDKRRPLSEIIKPTYFTGLDLIPGNLELMEYEHDTPRALAERSTEPF
ncbi:AAA family ATPase, partial [Escherichia coli]|uniref:AAA family ATPase n=3 Tax=Pseudomonadota TaxID=1224 RepID=UPI001EDB7D49